jgi:pyrimidine operon attenuation protein/uracil phosphoribosyltransferase
VPESSVILNAQAVHRVLTRIAHEIVERDEPSDSVVVVGIQTGGVLLAARLGVLLQAIWGHPVSVGTLDVGTHRDDLNEHAAPFIQPTEMPFDINGKTVVLVDDVLCSGRTTRAALDALNDFGRPRRVQLAVLVDRGRRELPIKPDFVGKNVETKASQRIEVRLKETHGEDVVHLQQLTSPAT